MHPTSTYLGALSKKRLDCFLFLFSDFSSHYATVAVIVPGTQSRSCLKDDVCSTMRKWWVHLAKIFSFSYLLVIRSGKVAWKCYTNVIWILNWIFRDCHRQALSREIHMHFSRVQMIFVLFSVLSSSYVVKLYISTIRREFFPKMPILFTR